MADLPPRLDTNPAAPAGTGYAPISWPAVASLVVAVVFLAILLVLVVLAVALKLQLQEQTLLVLPAAGILLAFVARRQILNAEGTRTGLEYANWGWWGSVVGGSGYLAYLLALNFAVTNDAQQVFVQWTNAVTAADPADPDDPHLYDAGYLTLPVGPRRQLKKGAKDHAAVDRAFGEQMVQFRQLDAVRVAARNRGAVRFHSFGVRDWQRTPAQIQCVLACKMATPEGDFSLVVPMEGVEKPAREWRVIPSKTGLVEGRALTRYGWMVYHLEETGRAVAGPFLGAAGARGFQWVAYETFVRADPAAARAGATAAVAGWAGAVNTRAGDYERALDGGFLTLPGGQPLATAEQRAKFRSAWEGGRLRPPGAVLRDSSDVNPTLRVTPDGAELVAPAEVDLGVATGEAARGRVVLSVVDPALAADLAKAREAGGETTKEPPADVVNRAVAWRVVRIESDLKGIKVAPPGGGPGGGGGEMPE